MRYYETELATISPFVSTGSFVSFCYYSLKQDNKWWNLLFRNSHDFEIRGSKMLS